MFYPAMSCQSGNWSIVNPFLTIFSNQSRRCVTVTVIKVYYITYRYTLNMRIHVYAKCKSHGCWKTFYSDEATMDTHVFNIFGWTSSFMQLILGLWFNLDSENHYSDRWPLLLFFTNFLLSFASLRVMWNWPFSQQWSTWIGSSLTVNSAASTGSESMNSKPHSFTMTPHWRCATMSPSSE